MLSKREWWKERVGVRFVTSRAEQRRKGKDNSIRTQCDAVVNNASNTRQYHIQFMLEFIYTLRLSSKIDCKVYGV